MAFACLLFFYGVDDAGSSAELSAGALADDRGARRLQRRAFVRLLSGNYSARLGV
jgi:hypothetical protein